MTPAVIFASINLTKAIAKYLGLIESTNSLLNKLVHQAFRAAKSNLEYAYNSSGATQMDYLRQARNEFNQAVAVEDNEPKIYALLGLAMCQHFLGNASNAKRSMSKIRDVELSRSEKFKYGTISVISSVSPLYELGDILGIPTMGTNSLAFRKTIFSVIKANALATK